MNALKIISEIETAGGILSLSVDEIKLRAAPGIVTADMVAGIKQHKAEIIDILNNRREVGVKPSPATRPKKRQVSCRAYDEFTKVLKDCIDEQGDHCGGCELNIT